MKYDSREESLYPVETDRFLLCPFVLIAILCVIDFAIRYHGQLNLLFVAGLFILLLWGIAARLLFRASKLISRQYYKSGLSLVLAISILFSIVGIPGLYSGPMNFAVVYTRLLLNEDRYMKEIRLAQPDSQEPRYAEFSWGEFELMCSVAMVYDESDELALPADRRSKEWWERIERVENKNVNYVPPRNMYRPPGPEVTITKIKPHFYYVTFCSRG